ncbi:hypothetical protein PoB_007185600 [Plakobranchus ocellatus]|uniref:Uncharacterized protein n=1 Tax=Plakobranchus ocellatus TaxID=259542 RepID=A0AAV4DMH8_9GAST|nr:hypothetical protein PoB_007185600 [Plakobranchus ocellatus]
MAQTFAHFAHLSKGGVPTSQTTSQCPVDPHSQHRSVLWIRTANIAVSCGSAQPTNCLVSSNCFHIADRKSSNAQDAQY